LTHAAGTTSLDAAMTTDTPTYQFRAGLHRKERTYRLTPDALAWSDSGGSGSVPYSDMQTIRVYTSPGVANPTGAGELLPEFQGCIVSSGHNGTHSLTTNHYVSLGNFEDRSATFKPFAAALVQHVTAANPATVFIGGLPMTSWLAGAIVTAISIGVAVIMVAVIVELYPKGTSELWTLLGASAFLIGLLAAIPAMVRGLIGGWPRPIDPRR
jgi:hypothetical protein